MLVYRNGYQINSAHPNDNYSADTDCWVVPDGSELANKIISTPYWEPVTDEDGNLINIIPIEPPITPEEQIAELKNQLTAIDLQTVRPLRAVAAGTATDEDRDKLTELEAQAEELRAEIKTIYELTEE